MKFINFLSFLIIISFSLVLASCAGNDEPSKNESYEESTSEAGSAHSESEESSSETEEPSFEISDDYISLPFIEFE